MKTPIARTRCCSAAVVTVALLGCTSCNPTAADGTGSRPPPSTARATDRDFAHPPPGRDSASAPPPAPDAASSSEPAAPSGPADGGAISTGVDTSAYGWHADPSIAALRAVDRLVDRFAPPAGFARVALEPASFGAWLRALPLAAPGTPVLAFDGRTILDAGDPRLAAVATLDVGTADLQQCADAVMRLHAEWSWSRGNHDVSYRAASGVELPFARWARGQRLHLEGKSLVWAPSARPAADHATFRRYLDAVFTWANTVSLARQAKPMSLEQLRPGDFLILPGNPGHSVLVLDLAMAADGRRVVMLGQSYMPAQSYHVLRASPGEVWFAVDPAADGIQTPFWPAPFPWSSIRRLDS